MLQRGVPKAKPFSEAQLAEQEVIRQMLLEKKGLAKT